MGQRLGISDADEQRADEAGALRNADGVDVVKLEVRFGERFAHNGDDLPKVFARGEFGNDAAILPMDINLRRDDAGKDFAAVGNNGRSRFVAGRFNAKDTSAHEQILAWRKERTREAISIR